MTTTTAPSWTEAEDEWLRECYPLYSNAALAEFKALDGWPRSAGSISSRAQRLGLIKADGCGGRHAKRFWTDERREWFVAFVPGHSEGEISAEHERLFGTPLTEGQIGNAKCKFGVKSGTVGGRFKKGNVPANKGRPWDEWMPEGSREGCRRTQFKAGQLSGIAKERSHGLLGTRLTKDGYTEIRIDPRGARHTTERWIPLGAFNWMAANGREWPDGCKCAHADRDLTNDAADNIVPVPNDLWPLVCGAVRGQLEWHDRETLELAVTFARITLRRRELERERRRIEGRPWASDAQFDSWRDVAQND